MRYITADLHLGHPLVAATRGFFLRFPKDDPINDEIRQAMTTPQGINQLRHRCSKHEFEALVDVEAHDNYILKRLSANIGKNDELYIVGDLAIGAVLEITQACEKLNQWLHVPVSHRHLILGNHDGYHPSKSVKDILYQTFGTIDTEKYMVLEDEFGLYPTILTHLPSKQHMLRKASDDSAMNAHSPELLKHSLYIPHNCLHLYGHTHSKQWQEYKNSNAIQIGLDAWDLRPVSESQILNAYRQLPTKCFIGRISQQKGDFHVN